MEKNTYWIVASSLLLGLHTQISLAASSIEERLENSENKIKILEARLRGTRSAVKENRSRISDASDRLKINGFISAGVAVNDGEKVVEPFTKIDDDYSASSISKSGVQFNFRIFDEWNAVAQLVSKGVNTYQIEAEWAYLNWQVSDSLQFKFGRQRAPFYMLSEFLDVGYALPWTIAPLEMYNLTTSTVDGVSSTYSTRVGPTNFQWLVYAGSSQGEAKEQDASYESNEAIGTNLVMEIDTWLFRVGYSVARLEASAESGGLADQFIQGVSGAVNELGPLYGVVPNFSYDPDDQVFDARYISAGFTYDSGNLLVMGEIANLRLEDSYQPAGDSGYIMVGYRIGKWMPHITFAKSQTDSKSDSEVRALQGFLADTANSIYSSTPPGTPGLAITNAGINSQIVADNGLPAGSIPSNYVLPGTVCTTLTCSTSVLASMGVRDSLLAATTAYGETLYNVLEQRIQEQQSYSIGVVYDVAPGVKAKLQATHYEQFGSATYQYLDLQGASFGGSQVDVINGFKKTSEDGNGRFIGDPGSIDNHTAIYSFSVDAVF